MPFEFDGKKYQQASSHQKEWGKKLLSEFTLYGHERILDLGCGDGVITAHLADLVPHGSVLGIDASEGMIQTAREIKRQYNLQFQVMNINSLGFVDEFDLIFSNATLHWVMDHRMLLINVHRALKHDGIVRFNFAGAGNCINFFRIVRKTLEMEEFAPYFQDFSWPWYMPDVEEYRSLACRFHFSEINVWGENADRNFPDPEAMTKWIEQPSLVPFLAYLSEETRQRFRDQVVERMIKETRQDDGTCFETFRRINLYAQK